MSKSTIAFITLLMFMAVLLGYNYIKKPFSTITVPEVSSQPTPAPTTSSFDELSAEQRVALMIAAPVTIERSGEVDQDQLRWITDHKPGVVTLFGDVVATQSAQQVITTVSEKYSPLWAVDHEGGSVQRLSGTGFTVLPSWQQLCLQPVAKRKELLGSSAAELDAVGIDIVFGPVIDLSASGSALGSRTCGSSPELVAQRAQEFIEAFTSEDILPVIKHFPGIGSVKQDLHRQAVATTTNENELAVYEYILEKHPALGVMVAHISLEELDGEVCSLSNQCVSGLKNAYKDIIVFTDALEMESAGGVQASASAEASTLAERAVAAVKAGNDVLVFGRDASAESLDGIVAELVTLYNTDEAARQMIDSSAKKIFEYSAQGQQ